MIKRLLIFFMAISFVVCFGCTHADDKTKNTAADSEASDDKRTEKGHYDYYEDIIRKYIKDNYNFDVNDDSVAVPALYVEVVGVTEHSDYDEVYANIIKNYFLFKDGIFKDGIFKDGDGGIFSAVYEINKSGEVADVKLPSDGSEVYTALVELAHGDKVLAGKMVDFQSTYSLHYDELMQILKDEATAMGLKDVAHDLDSIPGYENDVKYVDKNSVTVYVIKTDDYNALMEERKTIVPPDKPGTHWVYRSCIEYHKPTGICKDGLLGYSD